MKLSKKITAVITAATMFAANSVGFMPNNPIKLPALSASAADIVASGECGAQGDNVVWQLDSEGTLTISGKGAMIDDPQFEHYDTKNVVIENGVTNIGNFAFYNYPSLTSIIIPDSVVSIGEGAFYSCTSLATITITESVTSIGGEAFFGTPWLDSKREENPLVIVNEILIDGVTCEGDVVIPNSVTSIGNYAFGYCSELTSIKIPDTVTDIGAWAFSNCSGLASILIPDSIKIIRENAFYECTSLTTITIPDSVASIGQEAFYFCDSLTSITIENQDCEIYDQDTTIINNYNEEKFEPYFDGTIYGYAGSTAQAYAEKYNRNFVSLGEKPVVEIIDSGECGAEGDNVIWQLDSDGTLTISGEGEMENWGYGYISYFAPWLLWSFSDISSVIIEDGVASIGESAFKECNNLTSITIADSVTSIGDHAFYDCAKLSSVIIPDSVTSIGSYAFHNTQWHESRIKESPLVIVNGILIDGTTCEGDLIIPDSVTSIGKEAFYNCVLLNSVTIPNSVTSIGEMAFQMCTSLTSITIPDSVVSIEKNAFENCTALKSITIPASIKIINEHILSGCAKLSTVTICDGIESIGDYAFYECTSLTSIIIPNSVTSIGAMAFYNCNSLSSVTISDGVKDIGNSAFDTCTSLTTVIIPDSVASIGSAAFYGCSSLTSITISESVTSIGSSAFHDTPWFELKINEFPLVIVNGILIDGTTCESDVVIPNNVTCIGTMAFRECNNLTSIKIPESVIDIGESAFVHCANLNSIIIENKECEIYDSEFVISNGWDGETFETYFNGTIYGYEGSTAQAYAEKYNRKFAVIDGEKPVTTSTTTTSTATSTTTTTTTTTTTKTTTTRIVTTTAVSNKPAFVNGADNWSFSNSRNNFGNSYYMKDEYWNTLINGLSNIEKEYMNEYVRNSYWGGSCYGMAVTSILASHDILKPNNYQNNANFLNDILSPPNNDVKSIINYYFALQFTDVMQQQTNISVFTDEKDKLDYIVKCLEDNSPTLLCYFGYFHGFDWGGHAVVAYDVEYGTYSYGGKAYNGKIVTYDNNSVDYDADYCLYFNSSNGNWIIPAYELDSTNESVLGLITDDLKYINYHGYLNGTTNKSSNDYIATLRSASLKDNYNLIKANYSNGIWMNSSTSTDDIKVFSSLTDNNFENSDMMFAMKDANSGYIMKTEKINALDLSMRYENTLLNIDADACQIAKFSPNGYVEIEGEQTAYDIEIVLNDGHMVTDWYGLSVTGDNADKVNLRTVKNGYIMSATDLNNITAEAFNDNVTAEAQFSTDYNSVFIYEIDEKTIGVSVDTDGDGTYETNINTQPTYTLGDVNDDETIDASDASLVLAEYAKIQTGGNQTFTENQTSAADVNNDGVVDASDASKILVYYAAISTGKEPSWK